jgi:MATE family multidrug resistance protein
VTAPAFVDSARRIAALAWPMYVGQVAVLAFSTVDTVLVARYSALDLAALAIGSAAYISVFIGFMGVVMALGPIAGQLYGAGRRADAGRALQQTIWLALALSALGGALLLFPEPFLALAQAPVDVAERARGYLAGVALSLPAALVFTAYRAFNVAVSRPKAVMALQIGALLVKVPLTALLVFGLDLGPVHVAAGGAPGCGAATAMVMTAQALAAMVVLRRDPFYAAFGLQGRFAGPERSGLVALLRLGVPMGLSMLVEVTGFTFMAFFIARFGATPVAGHQIAVNLVSLMYMMPLALANAASTLVAQRIGAGQARAARRVGWHGLGIGAAAGAVVGTAVFGLRGVIVHAYTDDAAIVAAALPLLAWVALFHLADATQAVTAFVLRAHRIVNAPLVINALAIWGVGLAGGYALAFDTTGGIAASLQGARGFWSAATAGLAVTALLMLALLARTHRRERAPNTDRAR